MIKRNKNKTINRYLKGGVAKPGQTRRTQDQYLCEIPSFRGSWVRIPPPPLKIHTLIENRSLSS